MRERRPGVWELRVYVGRDPVTNNPRQQTRTFHGGKRAAQSALSKLVTEVGEGKLAGTNATLGLLLDRYLEHLDRKGLSPQTLHAYRRYVTLHLKPALGAKAVRKLTAWDLDQFYAALTDGGKSAATVRQAHAILSGALGQAVKWGWAPANVARSASPPVVHQRKVTAPSIEQVRALVAAAEDRDPILAALLMLAAITGARRGELCAIRWTDVDLIAGQLRIAHAILDLPGRVEIKDTKSHQERTLALGEAGVALLELHRQAVEDRALRGETELLADAFLFSERLDGATPVRPDKVTRFFTTVRDELKMPALHLHGFRHFVASQLAARGDVSVRTLAGRLGHADASVTMRVYAAFMPSADVEAADHLGRALNPGT